MPATRSSPRLLAASLLIAAVSALSAQGSGLTPGTFVGTTLGYAASGRNSSDDGVFAIDTFAGTATRLTIAGFPSVTLEAPWSVHVESRLAFLVGSGSFVVGQWNFTLGNVYRMVSQNGGWTATRLNTNTITEGVMGIAEVGNTIFFTTTDHYWIGDPPSAKLWSMPRWGGTASVVVDLTALGAQGDGGALVALGSTLHVFVFRSSPVATSQPGEHWAVDTTQSPPAASLVGALPPTIRVGAGARHFGANQAHWDAHSGAFVISGVYGDILWRDPVGNDLYHWADPTPMSTSNISHYFGSVGFDSDTGAVVVGDKNGHLEELRSPRGGYLPDHITLPATVNAMVVGLDYLPTTARHLPDGPIGCPQQSGQWPCSYIASRPTAGNVNFALTLETSATAGFLVLGLGNAIWGSNLLPYSLSSWGAPGCVVGASVDAVVPFVGPDPSVAAPLPNGAFTAWTQWAVLDPANPLGLVLSETRRMEVR